MSVRPSSRFSSKYFCPQWCVSQTIMRASLYDQGLFRVSHRMFQMGSGSDANFERWKLCRVSCTTSVNSALSMECQRRNHRDPFPSPVIQRVGRSIHSKHGICSSSHSLIVVRVEVLFTCSAVHFSAEYSQLNPLIIYFSHSHTHKWWLD